MKHTFVCIIFACMLLPSCNPTLATNPPEQINIQYTAASVPWLASVYECAGRNVVGAEQRGTDFLNLQSANMVIRLGKPDNLAFFAYKIASDNLLVIVNSKNPTSQLTKNQVYRIFTGQVQNWKSINGTDSPIQVWVFAAEEDIQKIFRQTVLEGSTVTSAAHLANSPDEMVQAVEKDTSAIGIITHHWMTGNISGAYTVPGSLPVLAITLAKPQGTIANFLGCLQK